MTSQTVARKICQLASLLSALVLAATSVNVLAADTIATPVEVAKVVLQSEQALLWAPGTVVSRQSANIAPEISGRLDWLAEVGDFVSAGEAIARISDTAWEIQLRTDEAEIRRLEANEEFLRRQLERFRTLSDSNSMAASELDRLTMDFKMLEQERAAREARRDGTLYNIEVATVVAPFGGLVVERNAEVGEFARVGDPVLRIVNTAALEVRARAPVGVAKHVQPGQAIVLESGDSRLETVVKALVPTGDDRSRMVELRVEIPAGDWVVGEAVRIGLPNGATLAQLAISRDALVLRDREVYVFKVLENATAKRISVRPGKGAGDVITVEGDLNIGDVVVIRGAETLKDGQVVRVLGGSVVAQVTERMFDKG